MRLAANHAIGRQAINQAETLGFSRITGSIIPITFDFYWQPPVHPYDPGRPSALLAEAGHPTGFDAGDYFVDAPLTTVGATVVHDLQKAGIRSRLRPSQRAAFAKPYGEKK